MGGSDAKHGMVSGKRLDCRGAESSKEMALAEEEKGKYCRREYPTAPVHEKENPFSMNEGYWI